MTDDPRLGRLSLNQRTVDRWSVAEAVSGCVRAGIPSIGLWREHVAEAGVQAAARLVDDAGLRVSSLCRGGFLTAPGPEGHRRALEDNRRAIEEAATLGAECLVLVVGGLPAGSEDLPAARDRVAERLAELVPVAIDADVRLALEPLHPMYCADRSVLSTLAQALDLAQRFPASQVGVVVDTFHVWWDPDLASQLARAAGRIALFQVCDWILPIPEDNLLARGMMGDGHIDFPAIRDGVQAAGYGGDIETEIFNAAVWAADPDRVLATVKERFLACVMR